MGTCATPAKCSTLPGSMAGSKEYEPTCSSSAPVRSRRKSPRRCAADVRKSSWGAGGRGVRSGRFVMLMPADYPIEPPRAASISGRLQEERHGPVVDQLDGHVG